MEWKCKAVYDVAVCTLLSLTEFNTVDSAVGKYLFYCKRGCLWGRFICTFVYLVACSTDCISLCRHRMGVSVRKWKLRQVTTVSLGISIIFVMDFLASVSRSSLIASDERCYKSAKCYYKGVFFFQRKGFF